ncbi:MAG: PEP/pyruvate-binding domain-containing protein [Solirubrobacteraceae bacterium]
MSKDRIIATLGESELLLPDLMSRALSANDRVKYLLTLLQSARAAADGDPDASDLRQERLASGVPDAALDRVVQASTRREDGLYAIPGAAGLVDATFDELETMLAPLRAASVKASGKLDERVGRLRQGVHPDGDAITAQDISRLTAGRRRDQDSLHLVVMDAHRELNELARGLASESIAGARAYGIGAEDRPLVGAFARGVERTQRLRFDHPGLGTVATRSGDALVVQNDIGETDAHVVVVKIVERTVTIIYTDVHLPRLLFFQRMLAGAQVSWEDTRSRGSGATGEDLYHLAVGRFTADSQAALEAFLELLGSRMVFLIDWNRARKRLRGLVGNRAAVELLDWAAARELGHMAFLLAGGEQLVYGALTFVTGRGTRAGESLTDALGDAAAISYMRAVLRICSDGLLAGRSLSLVGDEVRAELIGYVRTARQELLDLIAAHAELVVSIGEAARDALEQAALEQPSQDRAEIARLARDWEQRADELVNEVRGASARAEEPAPFVELVQEADDVADALEEAAFSWSLLPQGRLSGSVLGQSRRMMALALEAARSHLRAVHLARAVRRGSPSEDMDSFLETTHRIVALERDTDEALREVQAALVLEVDAAGELFVIAQATQACEEAADALMRAAQLLRLQVLGNVVRSEPLVARAEPPSTRAVPTRDESESIEELCVVGRGEDPIPDIASIGAKGHGLARMARAKLPVPEAAILSTAVYREMAAHRDDARLRTLVSAAVGALQERSGLRLGSARRPLILSVRSGAPASMPGMLETVLDVGLCDESVEGLITLTGNPRLAWDSYRRLVESFARVVAGCPIEQFEQATAARMEAAGVSRPHDLDARTLAELTGEHLERFRALTGKPFPQNPVDQVQDAVRGVLESWDAPKARDYRRLHELPETLGTAVILQRMVFGNAGGLSGSGVGFTRDPATGERRAYVEFLRDAQGEDVVGGRRTPEEGKELALLAPEVHQRLDEICRALEAEFHDAQEFEFTVQDGELFLLQTRTAKCTPWAALHIAVDQVREGLISDSEARERLAGLDLQGIHRTHVLEGDRARAICRAQPVSMGVASGPIALDVEAAERLAREGREAVLIRRDTSTEDLAGVIVAAGLLTSSGGRTSHAAVVARELGKPCVVGASGIDIDLERRRVTIGGREFAEGEQISIDGESGRVFAGVVQIEEERPTADLAAVAAWQPA